MVRHGSGPERAIRTGVGPVPVRRPKVRDPGAGEPARLASAIPPRRARRTRSLDALLPVPCPHGVSTGDFQEALAALLGRDAPNLSPSVIGRLKTDWEAEHERWRQRDLSARRTVHVWADGVHLQARMGEADGPNAAERMLVLIGAHARGQEKELVGFQAGVRESARDAGASCSSSSRPAAWPPRPRSPRATAPWASGGRSKRCSPAPVTNAAGRKAANVLDKVPRSVQPGMKAALREACCAPDRAAAGAAVAIFAEKYGAKRPKAVECPVKDQDALLAFLDFPAEHWDHCGPQTPSKACSPP